MLTITENAKQLLKGTLTAHSDDPEVGLRLSLKPPGDSVSSMSSPTKPTTSPAAIRPAASVIRGRSSCINS